MDAADIISRNKGVVEHFIIYLTSQDIWLLEGIYPCLILAALWMAGAEGESVAVIFLRQLNWNWNFKEIIPAIPQLLL